MLHWDIAHDQIRYEGYPRALSRNSGRTLQIRVDKMGIGLAGFDPTGSEVPHRSSTGSLLLQT